MRDGGSQRELGFRHHLPWGYWRQALTAALFAGNFFLCGLLCRFLLCRFRLFLRGRLFCGFLRRLLDRLFLGGRLLDWSFLGRRFLLWRPALASATTRWSWRRFRHRWRRVNLVVFLYENGFFLLFFLFFQILFQRFAVGAAVTVLIRLIVPTVESR